MGIKSKRINFADLIRLYFMHPSLWLERSFYWLPSLQEKELLEYLLNDKLLVDEHGHGFIHEFEVAVAICLEELAKELPDLFKQLRPVIINLKAEVQKMAKDKKKESFQARESQIKWFVHEKIEKLVQNYEQSKVTVKPFANHLQIRKKIIILALLRSGFLKKGSEELRKLLSLDCQEFGIDLQEKIQFDL